MRSKREKAEVTVFLSLVFILLVTFSAGVLESASIQVSKNMKRADMNRSIESVFAEYQQELLKEYDVFGLDASYETGRYSKALLFDRLEYYGATNTDQSLSRIQFMTDHNGQGFYDQVTYYMEDKYGLNLFSGKSSQTNQWKDQDSKIDDYQEAESHAMSDLNSSLEEAGGSLESENNPIDYVESLKKASLLDLVMPEGSSVSSKNINLSGLVSHRGLNQGFGDFSDVAESGGTLSNLLFGEYLLEHFSYASEKEKDKNGKKEGVLEYEVEYLYAGKDSDRDNLETVVKRLLLMRFVANYAFVRTSGAKRSEAEVLAASLAAVLANPVVELAATEAILCAWAYGESIVDLRALLKGNRVPLTKSEESWQLSLAGLMRLKEEGAINDGRDDSSGLSYKEYLRVLLFLNSQEKLRMRALDLIEKNLQVMDGLSFFKADQCVCRMEVKSKCKLRRSITYTFPTYFGYK